MASKLTEQIYVVPKGTKTPDGYLRLDVTSQNKKLAMDFSPFYLGPVQSPEGLQSKLVENLWAFSKVYSDMVDCNNNPTLDYFKWRAQGFMDTKAHRHAHEGKPLYSYWGGNKLGYIEARKQIYLPAYVTCLLRNPEAFGYVKQAYTDGYKFIIVDYDGYNFKKQGLSYLELLNNPSRVMGHGHIIAMMLECPELVHELLFNSIYGDISF